MTTSRITEKQVGQWINAEFDGEDDHYGLNIIAEVYSVDADGVFFDYNLDGGLVYFPHRRIAAWKALAL